MGNLTSSANVNDLILTAFNGDADTEKLKAERKNILSSQQNNLKALKQKLGSYRAKMASQGAGDLNEGVELGLIEDVKNTNNALGDTFNQKLKAKTRANRQKALLAAGDLIKTFSGDFAKK